MDTITVHKKGSYHIFRTEDRRLEHLDGSAVEIIRVMEKSDEQSHNMYDVAVVQSPSNKASCEGKIIEVFHDELMPLSTGRIVCRADKTDSGFAASCTINVSGEDQLVTGRGPSWNEMVEDMLRALNDAHKNKEITNRDIFIVHPECERS